MASTWATVTRSIPAYLAVIVSVDLPTLDAGGSFAGDVGERLIERRGICHYCGLIKCPLLAHFSDLVITSSDVRSSGQSGPRRIHDWRQSRFGGGAHCIEQAARAIAGRLIPQLPARRRFHRTLLISAGPSSWARAAVPYRAVRMAGFDGGVGQNPHDYRHART